MDATTLEQRFWRKVQKSDDANACWEWLGALNNGGYGKIRLDSVHFIDAHRAAWLIAFGEIPADLRVCHTCDNPRCVRHDHLWLGTAKENSQDMVKKGRHKSRPAAA